MSNIKYNEKEEAYELPYKLWDTSQTVRFYVESEEEIMKKVLELRNVYVDLDDEDIVVCFETGTDDGYMKDFISVELFADMFEIIDWVNS